MAIRVAFVLLLFAASGFAQRKVSPPVVDAELGTTNNVHTCGKVFLAGQPQPEDIKSLKAKGFGRVITLRFDNETDWDEKAAVASAGLDYVSIPLGGEETLTDATFERIRSLLGDTKSKTLFHCGSANRVGGVWLAHRVLDQGVELETAVREAKEVGLRSPVYEKRARQYIAAEQAKLAAESASDTGKPGLNEKFLDPDLKIDEWLARFEVESREVYAAKEKVLAACNVKPGMEIADVGAGTGLYTRLFSRATGSDGWVYAVDISMRFLQHIARESKKESVRNVTTVLGAAKSIGLPPESVDLTFICDTYHHFEYPADTLASIHRALRPGGELIVIDFERIPGKSREWIVGHVRAGKDVFRGEIEAAGFGFVEEVQVDGFEENYFLRFRKR